MKIHNGIELCRIRRLMAAENLHAKLCRLMLELSSLYSWNLMKIVQKGVETLLVRNILMIKSLKFGISLLLTAKRTLLILEISQIITLSQ
jgi:hypothetical protein